MDEPRIRTLEGYITTREAAGLLGYTRFHVSLLCRGGHMEGAVKMGRDWLIPTSAVAGYKPGPKGFAAVKARNAQITP